MTRRAAIPFLSLVCCTALLWGTWRFTQAPPVVSERAEVDAFRAELPLRVEVRMRSPKYRQEPQIRVGLKEQPATTLSLEIQGGYRIQALDGGGVLQRGKSLAATKVTASKTGLMIGAKTLSAPAVEIIPERSPAVWVDGHQYRGSIRLYRREGTKVLPVNVLPLEQYIASVIDSEMPAAFPEEARRAQAIVARTYALYQKEQAPRAAVTDLFASTRSQKYLGFQYRDGQGRLLAGESEASRATAKATRGLVGTHRGELFCTYYCAVCGGRTVEGTQIFSDAAPPLKSVACDWCKEARLYRWQAEISKRDAQKPLQSALAKDGKKLGTLKGVAAAKKGETGAGAFYQVKDDKQSLSLSGAAVRQALGSQGLYSPTFTVEDRGQHLVFSGRGHGHGVGLCQWGARGLAQEGRTADQIFAHYYRGAAITELGYR